MKISKIYAVNFRNYKSCDIAIKSMINVFFGDNAQGKTNILEAIFFSASGFSHRTSDEEELVYVAEREMSAGAVFHNYSGEHTIRMKKFFSGERWKKEIFFDDAKITPKEHYGSLNAVMFSPEDLQLVKGDGFLRRRFFNMQIAQTDPVYYDLLLKYNRVLQQRNKLLKDIREKKAAEDMLLTWNEEFSLLAASIIAKRSAALEKLENISSRIYFLIAGAAEELVVRYKLKSYGEEIILAGAGDCEYERMVDFYRNNLQENTISDILRGFTGIGPHRDDLQIFLDGKSMRAFGSQGQQRTCALAMKLAQLEYIYRETGEYPVLLLDDVMSELDGSRREKLLKFIDGRVQTFVTVNDRDLIPALAGNAYFRVKNGIITEESDDWTQDGKNECNH